jgi:hypothetical protein
VVVALDGAISLAPAGTTLPTNLGALNSAFYDLGYQSDDGVSFSVTPDVNEIRAWQSASAIRKIVTARDLGLGFTALQWNVATFAAAFGGGDWSEPSAGVFRYDPPADEDALVDYAAVLDFEDGDKQYRLVVKEANITDTVEAALNRGSAAGLGMSLDAITPDGEDRSWYLLTNDPALEPVAS